MARKKKEMRLTGKITVSIYGGCKHDIIFLSNQLFLGVETLTKSNVHRLFQRKNEKEYRGP